MVAAAVDELDGEGPDGIRTEPAALGVGAQEEVDPGVAEVRLVLLDGLDVADDLAVVLDDEGSSSGSPSMSSATTRSRSKAPHQRATSGSARIPPAPGRRRASSGGG